MHEVTRILSAIGKQYDTIECTSGRNESTERSPVRCLARVEERQEDRHHRRVDRSGGSVSGHNDAVPESMRRLSLRRGKTARTICSGRAIEHAEFACGQSWPGISFAESTGGYPQFCSASGWGQQNAGAHSSGNCLTDIGRTTKIILLR
jgi:hypothetical protein